MAEWILVPSDADPRRLDNGATVTQDSWTVANEMKESSRELLGTFEDLALFRLGPGLFGLTLAGHFGKEPLLGAMRQAWNDESSADGWAMVVVVTPNTSYDLDVRNVYKAPDLRPATHVAVVTRRLLHRVVITGLSLPVRATTGSVLSVHRHLDQAWQAAEGSLAAKRFGATGS